MAKHHYVPQFYLKRFVDRKSLHDKNPYLWLGELQTNTVKRRSPKNTARLTGFYEWGAHEISDVPSIEGIYSKIEDRVSDIYRFKLDKLCLSLTAQERFDLSLFLGFQLTRVPSYRKIVEEVLEKRGGDFVSKLAADEQRLQAWIDKRSCGDGGLTVDELRASILRQKVLPRPEYILASTLRAALDFLPVIFSMDWVYWMAPDTGGFLTSDSPVSLCTPDRNSRRIDFKGGHNPDLEIFFPLSPRIALSMHQKNDKRHLIAADATQVRQTIWLSTLPTARRFIFAPSRGLCEWALREHIRNSPDWRKENVWSV